MNRFLIIALVLIILGSVIAYAVSRENDGSNIPVSTEPVQTYTNATYGYSLSYPESLAVEEFQDGSVVFTNTASAGVAGVRMIVIDGAAGDTLQSAAARELQTLCAADSPTESFSCTGLDSMTPFTATSGLKGYALTLKAEQVNIASGTATPYTKGPYFVFPLQISATASRVLVVHPPLNLNADEVDAAIVRAIASSVSVSERPEPTVSVEAYIAANLSRLSSQPEVLGGTFYVTAIEAAAGSGTVSYEDGHNAYTADFTYTLSASGEVTVTSFIVRP